MSRSCCTTWLNAVIRREVATLRGGGNLNCRHIVQVSMICGKIFRVVGGIPTAARMLCIYQ
eukprot:11353039-Prorocentrum_lima.AAC.1